MQNCGLHETLLSYVTDILEKPNDETGELKAQLDELLDSLVSNYDNAELPLRQQKRIADLIVECKGDEAEAMRRFDAERSSFDEKTDLMELLLSLIHIKEDEEAYRAQQEKRAREADRSRENARKAPPESDAAGIAKACLLYTSRCV